MRAIFISLVLINAVIVVYFVTQPSEWNSAVDDRSRFSHERGGNDSEGLPTLTILPEPLPSPDHLIRKTIIPTPVVSQKEIVSPLVVTPKPVFVEVDQSICQLLGPYVNMMSARHARTRANRLQFDASVRRIKVPANVPIEYWVHIPRQPNRSTAIMILKRLQFDSVDSYLMTRGDNRNAISLGLFRNYDSARRLMRKMSVYGYPIEIQTMRKYKQEYWVELASGREMDGLTKRQIQGGDQQTQWRQSTCSTDTR